MDRRPYLHMYTSSNEVEEVGVISLTGMNIECDSIKEALVGVSMRCDTMGSSPDVPFPETILFHTVYRSELARARRTIAEGITIMDVETRPYWIQCCLGNSRQHVRIYFLLFFSSGSLSY